MNINEDIRVSGTAVFYGHDYSHARSSYEVDPQSRRLAWLTSRELRIMQNQCNHGELAIQIDSIMASRTRCT